jgi:hypothetical protein
MFPNPYDVPARFAQLAVDPPVTRPVGSEFLLPERPIADRNFAMLGTGVPKTTVHEHSKPHLPKNEIGFAEYPLVPPPAGDAVPSEHFLQSQFGVLVAVTANPGHDSGAFGFGEDITHCERFQKSSETILAIL